MTCQQKDKCPVIKCGHREPHTEVECIEICERECVGEGTHCHMCKEDNNHIGGGR